MEHKYAEVLETASPLNIKRQDDSANLCTSLGAENYTANKQLRPVGDFQQMINDHTEMFKANAISPQQNDKPMN